MKILVAGDTHGEPKHSANLVKEAQRAGIERIVQVGDFGLWTHDKSGITYLDGLNEVCRKNGVTFYALGGNHENWDHWNWHLSNGPKDYYGFTYLRSHIRIAPRVHYFNWEGKLMLMVAGAVSVDRHLRRMDGTEWWPQEALTDEELELVKSIKVDYLFTHDCSDKTPWHGRLKPDLDSKANRQRIDRVLHRSTPAMHFHGHMHAKYAWENLVADNVYTKTIGLDMNGEWYSWGTLDTETGEFLFRNETGVEWNRLVP